jgi:quaternary ammonium compound-resistance protein SugE
MSWTYLLLAGATEIAWAQTLKPTEGFTRPGPTAICVVLGILAVYLLSLALRDLPVGTGYAVFSGIGCLGAVAVGIALHDDPLDLGRLAAIALIVSGVLAARATA